MPLSSCCEKVSCQADGLNCFLSRWSTRFTIAKALSMWNMEAEVIESHRTSKVTVMVKGY
jgi:hypothetical protein